MPIAATRRLAVIPHAQCLIIGALCTLGPTRPACANPSTEDWRRLPGEVLEFPAPPGMEFASAGPDGLSFSRGTASVAVALIDDRTHGISESSDVRFFAQRMEDCFPGAAVHPVLKNGWQSSWIPLRCLSDTGAEFPSALGAATVDGRRYLFVGFGIPLSEARAFAESGRNVHQPPRGGPTAADGPWSVRYSLGNSPFRYSLPGGAKPFPSGRPQPWVGVRDAREGWNFCEFYDQGRQQVTIPLHGDGLSFLNIEYHAKGGEFPTLGAYIAGMDAAFPERWGEPSTGNWNGLPTRELAWKGLVRGRPSIFVDFLVEDDGGLLRIGLQTTEAALEENRIQFQKLKGSISRADADGGRGPGGAADQVALFVFAVLTLGAAFAPLLLAYGTAGAAVALGTAGLRAVLRSRRDGITPGRLRWVAVAMAAEAAVVVIAGPSSLLGLLCIGLGLIQGVILCFAYRQGRTLKGVVT